MVQTGLGLTVTVAVHELVHPLASVTVAVKRLAPSVVGATVKVAFVVVTFVAMGPPARLNTIL